MAGTLPLPSAKLASSAPGVWAATIVGSIDAIATAAVAIRAAKALRSGLLRRTAVGAQ